MQIFVCHKALALVNRCGPFYTMYYGVGIGGFLFIQNVFYLEYHFLKKN